MSKAKTTPKAKKSEKVYTSVVLRADLFAHVDARARQEDRSRNYIVERIIEADLRNATKAA